MHHANAIKNGVLTVVSVVGGGVLTLLGGWDRMLQALVVCMAVDFATGVAAAALGRSDKSRSGRISSRAALTGLVKKGFELLVILVAAQLEAATGVGYIRNAAICFFVGTEGISILENGGQLGVPLPNAMRRWFEALRERGDTAGDVPWEVDE